MEEDRRASDRRKTQDASYDGPERRRGERRLPVAEMTDEALVAAFEQTDGISPRADALLAEILARGLDL